MLERFFHHMVCVADLALRAQSQPNSSETVPSRSLDTGDWSSRSTRSKAANRVLAYLVIGVVICWTPNHVYWILVANFHYWNDTFLAVQVFAVYTYSWINPIICYLVLLPFRVAINNLFFCK